MRKALKKIGVLLLSTSLLGAMTLTYVPYINAEAVVLEDEDDESEEDDDNEEEADDDDENETGTSEKLDWSKIEALIQENMQAKEIETIYESKEALEFEEDDVKTVLNGYIYYHVADFNRDFRIMYDDQDQSGGVIVLDLTLINDSDEVVYHGNSPRVNLPYEYDSPYDVQSLLGNDFEEKFSFADTKLEPNSEKRGYIALAVTPNSVEYIDSEGKAILELPGFRSAEEFDQENTILENPEPVVPFSEDAEEVVSSQSEFYPDKTSVENMGNKEMLDSAEGVGATVESEGVTIEVDGYQFSEFTPGSAYEADFAAFDSGVVIANIKFNVHNDTEDETIDLSQTYGNLILGDMVQVSNEIGLELDVEEEIVEPGEMGTMNLVFLIQKDLYDKFGEDPFSLDVSIKNTDYQTIHDYQALIVKVER